MFKFSIFVIAFRNEPFIRRNGISWMSKSSRVKLCLAKTSCSICPSLPLENLVLYPISIPDCWPFSSRFNPSSSALVTMSLNMIDWTELTYISRIFLGICFMLFANSLGLSSLIS